MALNLFKKKKQPASIEIVAPVNGDIIPLEEVPDPVFNQKMMGEGIAITPSDGHFLSPVNGKIIQVPDTKHAVGILAEDGSEILIHIGLETVALKGEGFEAKVKEGDEVSVGQVLIEADLEYIRDHADTVTPIIITNSQNNGKEYRMTDAKIGTAGETVIITSTEA
ncbi:PTS glucose transporter subunit IIA [Virgibacillus profundi]|uniref:PTS glucose transporter subunit IIA n=1 Tax=Virgibacillus profundi TaxID=2024555 RepID=A0A2A2IKM2_9BACI|nr:PTS glucose transporter subunit IIA [Virgibacillus profundi]PAV31643.1 PTS glucose transporter subunit IIA [Virgibacillus profundi]PXY55829.1 PTS glucose transporter subunit IIA [Virgibacillus profundi]